MARRRPGRKKVNTDFFFDFDEFDGGKSKGVSQETSEFTFIDADFDEFHEDVSSPEEEKRKERAIKAELYVDDILEDEQPFEAAIQREHQRRKERYSDFVAPYAKDRRRFAIDIRFSSKVYTLIIAAVVLVLAIFGIYEASLVKRKITVEAGSNVKATDFLRNSRGKAAFSKKSPQFDVSVPGKYKLKVVAGGLPHRTTLIVEDTVPPEIIMKKVVVNYNESLLAEEFVSEVKDASAVTYSFITEPDFRKIGTQEINIKATDAGGNSVNLIGTMTVTPVLSQLTLEVGSSIPAPEEFVISGSIISMVTEPDEIDMKTLGSKPVVIKVDGKTYDSSIVLVDTEAPDFVTEKVTGYANAHYQAEDFVIRFTDSTNVTFAFSKSPIFTQLGEQEVTIVATDEGGNRAVQTATLELIEDTDTPVISGAKDLTIYAGNEPDWKEGVTVSDSCIKDLRLDVDKKGLNIDVPGSYTITYVARDASGHTSKQTVGVTVLEPTYDLDTVYSIVDRALSQIFTAGMNNRSKSEAIYKYIQSNMTVTDSSKKGDYVAAAYTGLTTGKGDSYVFAAVAKIMLGRAGIMNADIKRIPDGNKQYYWNLVDLEDGYGWRHYDTCPRYGNPYMCLIDDNTMMEYSRTHDNCYNYDRNKFPNIP